MEEKVNINIIHNSEIILYGLSEIIRNAFSNEINSAKQIHELPNYPNIKGCNIVIISEKVFEENIDILNRIFDKNQLVKYLRIKLSTNDNKLDCISLYESPSDIFMKISDLIKGFKIDSNDKNQKELSEREIDVLKLIAIGLTNKEIADKLFISVHTVITHRKNITEKLNIKSISGLTVYAVLKKYINIDDISPEELI